jgi:predicted GIY-YIG superfamily endonuclease
MPAIKGIRATAQTIITATGQAYKGKGSWEIDPGVKEDLIQFAMYRLNQDLGYKGIATDLRTRAQRQHNIKIGHTVSSKIVKMAMKRQFEWRARREGMKPEELLKENRYRSLAWWYDALRCGKWPVMLEARKMLDQREGLMDEFYGKGAAANAVGGVHFHIYIPDSNRSKDVVAVENTVLSLPAPGQDITHADTQQ